MPTRKWPCTAYWMLSQLLIELTLSFLQDFIAYTAAGPEKLLLLPDNQIRETTIEAYEMSHKNIITFLSTPPHILHRTQLLDMLFFNPLKNYFTKKSYAYMKQVREFSGDSRSRRFHDLFQTTIFDMTFNFNRNESCRSGALSPRDHVVNRGYFTDVPFLPPQLYQAFCSFTRDMKR